MMIAPPVDLSSMSPEFQAGYTTGNKDARQHRRRNRVLDDISGLTAYASDAALAYPPVKSQRLRADLIARFVEGYVQAYRLATGQ